MQRCSHLYLSGQQCDRESFPGSDFCEDHVDVHPAPDNLEDHPLRKLALRFAALILLIMFLIPMYYTLKSLYLGLAQQVEAEEGG